MFGLKNYPGKRTSLFEWTVHERCPVSNLITALHIMIASTYSKHEPYKTIFSDL